MRPSSLGGGRILRRTLSVRPSVCLSVCLSVDLESSQGNGVASPIVDDRELQTMTVIMVLTVLLLMFLGCNRPGTTTAYYVGNASQNKVK